MKAWWIGALLCALVVPGGCLLLAIGWWRRRQLARDRRTIDALIVPPVHRFGKLDEHDLSSTRAAADRRRQAAEDKRRDAARIESGQPVEDRLRLVR